MKPVFFDEAQKVWNRLKLDRDAGKAEFELKLHKKLLDVFHVGKYYYWFFDLKNMRFEYLSPQIKDVLGYDAEDVDLGFFMSKIHPDDQSKMLNYENAVIDFYKQLPLEKVPKYKVSYDYRMMDAAGQPIRILHQVVAAQYDDENNILMSLGVHTDISHIKSDNTSKLSFIGMDGEPSYINVNVLQTYKPSGELFTEREKEIIRLLLIGLQSAEIAAMLHISKFTVDTHRKNILQKADTRTTLELAVKVINEGLI